MDQLGFESENGSLLHALLEGDRFHPDGHEVAIPELERRRHPGDLIDPHQEITSEKESVLVQMLREDKAVILHVSKMAETGGGCQLNCFSLFDSWGFRWSFCMYLTVHRLTGVAHSLLMIKTLSILALSFGFLTLPAFTQEETGESPPTGSAPSFAGKSIDQLTADEVLKLVRYSYTLYNRDFTGLLRTGFASKTPFLMSLKPESIRFIFEEPSQVIYLDTKDNSFALFEGVGGNAMQPVPASKYAQEVRGTDVTYEDLAMRFLYWPNAKIVKLDKIKARECWQVRVLNPDGQGAYATVDFWIDCGSGGMIKMNGYNASGRPVRRFEVLSGKKFDDIWMVDEMRIETINPSTGQIKSSTRMQIKSTVN